MARIEPPAVTGMGEHVDWSLHRTEMAVGMGKFSEAVYGNSQLPIREREAARWTIALINHCLVCQDTRAKDAEPNHIDEGFYAEVAQLGHHRRAHRAREARRRVRPALRPRPPGHGRRVLGAAARGVLRRRGRRPHHLLRDVPRPGPGPGRRRRARARGAHPRLTVRRPGGPMAEHDLIIRGGTVLDGTGSPARTADVAITRRHRHRGRPGRRHAPPQELDADGLTVTPGLVDIHVHYDGQATWDDRLIPSAWHGVTTVVAGNCGVGFAPVRPADHDRLIQLMEGVEDIPGAALHEGLPWTWQSFPEFLDALDGRPYDVDLATHVPHGALRLNVMGERGAQREMATPDDIEAMADAGPARPSRPAPSASAPPAPATTAAPTASSRPPLTADADELLGIARAVGATGTGVLQVVSDFDDVDAEFGLFRSMAEASGRPLSFSLAGVDPAKYPRQLELLDQANAAGVRMRGQAAARAIGILVGLQCTVNPLAGNPVWQEIAALSVAEQARAMARAELQGAVPGRRRQAARRRRPDVRARRPARLRARPVHEHRGPRRARGARRPRPRLRPLRPGRGPHVPLRPDHQLVRRHPRRRRRDARPPAHRARPVRRRRPRRHHLRRQLPHHVPVLLGPRPRPRAASTSPTSCASTPRTPPRRSACSTAACSPRATGPT